MCRTKSIAQRMFFTYVSQARTYGAGKQRSQGFCALASRHCPQTARTCSPPHPPPASAPLALAARPATPPVSSLRTTRTLALTHRAAHTEHRPTHSPRTTRAHSTTRIRRHLPRRHLPAVPPAPARLPAEVWKPQTFSFYQSISNLDVSLPNLSKKDVKGLLFRK